MEREAAPREALERGAVAPVEREEAAGFARGRAGDARPLDHDRRGAAAGEEIGKAGPDRAGAADHDPHAPLPASSCGFPPRPTLAIGTTLCSVRSAVSKKRRTLRAAWRMRCSFSTSAMRT